MSDSHSPTPQERLAASRQAILRHMSRDEGNGPRPDDTIGNAAETHATSGQSPWRSLASLSHAARAWWQHQPIHYAFDMAVPVLGRFAERQPFKYLAVAAATGAVIVLIRPWRLISIGGLMLAAVKSAATPGILMSLLSSSSNNSSVPPNTDPTDVRSR